METDINAAIQKGYFKTVRFLIEMGADINLKDAQRRTPLINCALIENSDWGVGLARNLIEKGAIMGSRDKHGLNALHYACIYERLSLVRMLLSSADFNLNQTDRKGNTALHYSVVTANNKLTTLLLESLTKCGMRLDLPNKRGDTPASLAVAHGLESCFNDREHTAEEKTVDDDNGHPDHNGQPDDNKTQWEEDNSSEMSQSTSSVFSSSRRPRTASSSQSISSPRSSNGTGSLLQRPSEERLSLVARQPSVGGRQGSTMRQVFLGGRQGSAGGDLVGRRPRKPTSQDSLILTKEMLADKVYRTASLNDLRNNPSYLLQMSPAQYFRQSNGSHQAYPDQAMSETGALGGSNWKTYLRNLYSNYDFQFTKSFYKAAVPPDPETLLLIQQAAAQQRLQDELSDYGEVLSDRASVLSKRPSRKCSAKGDGLKSAQRKFSHLTAPIRGRRPSSTLSIKSQISLLDSSSTESLTSVNKPKKDDASDSSRSSKSRLRSTSSDDPPRPPSRAMGLLKGGIVAK